MKKLSSFFDTLGKSMILYENQFLRFKRIGIDPTVWPNSIKNAALVAFLEKLDKGYWSARQSSIDQGLDSFSDSIILPENDAELLRIYRQNIKTAKACDLAVALKSDPENVDSLLDDFKRTELGSIDINDFQTKGADHLKNIEARAKAPGEHIVTIKGFEMLSKMIGGFNPGRVSIVSAHTGFGKTNLALNLAIRAAKTMTVGIVNMEMIDTDIMDRLFAIESRKTHDQVAKGDIDWSHMIDFFSNDIPKKMFFTDGKNLSINEIYSYAYRLKKDKNLSILFLDYDQKIDLHLDNRTPEWKALQLAVHAIESMAKELNIHVLMLSQASDEGTPSGSKRSMYPTSVVLWFTKDIKGEKFILRPIKNRFGPTSMSIDLEYKPEMSLIYEKGLYDHNQSAIRPFGGTKENSGRKPSLF